MIGNAEKWSFEKNGTEKNMIYQTSSKGVVSVSDFDIGIDLPLDSAARP